METNTALIRKLGEGSFGKVFLAQRTDGNYYAVKVYIDPSTLGILSLNEIDILRRLVHPNLMYSFSTTLISGDRFTNLGIEMPLASSDLRSYIKANQDLPIGDKLKIFTDIVKGTHFLHQNHILHLDLKLDNILISDGRALVSDFGFSVYADITGSRYYNDELVTITYRAPELLPRGRFYDRKVDIWSLGIILLRMLNPNLVLYPSDFVMEVSRRINTLFSDKVRYQTLNNYLKDIDRNYRSELVDLLFSMLAINPNERPLTDDLLVVPILKPYNDPTDVGYVYNPRVKPSGRCSIYDYLAFNYMFKLGFSMNVRIETVFLAADLYQRCLYLAAPLTEKEDTNWANTLLLMSTCYWMAYKMIEDVKLYAGQLVIAAENIFSISNMTDLELAIVRAVNGTIYRWNLYTYSYCRHQLLTRFELLRQCHRYPEIDFDNLDGADTCTQDCSGCEPNNRFRPFFLATAYYQYMINRGRTVTGDPLKTGLLPSLTIDDIKDLMVRDGLTS